MVKIKIRVNWKKSISGSTPHVLLNAYGQGWSNSAKAKATGSGYDKLSAAVGEALEQIPELQPILLAHEELLKGCYGIYFRDIKDKQGEVTGRKAGWGSGVGISCFHRIVEKLGGTVVHADDDLWDYIEYTFDEQGRELKTVVSTGEFSSELV